MNMVKHRYIELMDVIVNCLMDYHKNSKCGCLMGTSYIKYLMDSRKLVSTVI